MLEANRLGLRRTARFPNPASHFALGCGFCTLRNRLRRRSCRFFLALGVTKLDASQHRPGITVYQVEHHARSGPLAGLGLPGYTTGGKYRASRVIDPDFDCACGGFVCQLPGHFGHKRGLDSTIGHQLDKQLTSPGTRTKKQASEQSKPGQLRPCL